MKLEIWLLFLSLTSTTFCCTLVDWWKSFDHSGWSTCNSGIAYINGLWRNDYGGNDDGIFLLEQASCCNRPSPYYNQPSNCRVPDWTRSFDKNHQWNTCPSGFFLRGLYRSSDNHWLYNIEQGKCCKPATHPTWYGSCYDENVRYSFDKKGLSKCKDGYFLTGLYRGTCDRLYCIETFKCCKMAPKPVTLTGLTEVKTRVMDTTQTYLALLAHYLGYGWAAGCQGQYVGEDFYRAGDSWKADKRPGPCDGYKSGDRLGMNYGDWGFVMKDIKYGAPSITSITPHAYIQGSISNSEQHPATQEVSHTVTSTRQVTHTTTSSWKVAAELGIEVSYTPPGATGGVGGKASFKFNYENGKSTTDSTAQTQTKSITLKSSKTLAPHTAAKYKIMVTNTRTTVPYTATIVTRFSAQLDGFLRWGQGYWGSSTNYHNQHRGSDRRPWFKYRFGDKTKPFYTALREQSSQAASPWQWHEMKQKYSSAQNVIDYLTDENIYTFKLSGQFDDVIGQHADIQWEAAKPHDEIARYEVQSDATMVEQYNEDEDAVKVFPDPPEVIVQPHFLVDVHERVDTNV